MEPLISPVQNSTHRWSPDNQGCQGKHWQPDGGDDLPCGGKDNWLQKGASEEPTKARFRKLVTLNICQAQLVTEANLKDQSRMVIPPSLTPPQRPQQQAGQG